MFVVLFRRSQYVTSIIKRIQQNFGRFEFKKMSVNFYLYKHFLSWDKSLKLKAFEKPEANSSPLAS